MISRTMTSGAIPRRTTRLRMIIALQTDRLRASVILRGCHFLFFGVPDLPISRVGLLLFSPPLPFIVILSPYARSADG